MVESRNGAELRIGRIVKAGAAVAAVVFLGIQFVPFGRDHVNPPIITEPQWSSPRVRALAVRACFDCHSNQTEWPWYARIAPMSWLVQRDVQEGRDELNWSEWEEGEEEGEDMAETILGAEMPPRRYALIHPEARLTDEEVEALVRGLQDTFPDD